MWVYDVFNIPKHFHISLRIRLRVELGILFVTVWVNRMQLDKAGKNSLCVLLIAIHRSGLYVSNKDPDIEFCRNACKRAKLVG